MVLLIDDFILSWFNTHKHQALWLVPLLAFLEACPGLGLFVSGVILLSVSTLLYTEQLATLSQIIPLAFVGACLADHLGFYLGRTLGPTVHQLPLLKNRATQLQKAEQFIRKYGAVAMVVGRLMTAIRSLVPMTLGASGVGRLAFSLADLLACTIWTAGLAALVLGLEGFFN